MDRADEIRKQLLKTKVMYHALHSDTYNFDKLTKLAEEFASEHGKPLSAVEIDIDRDEGAEVSYPELRLSLELELTEEELDKEVSAVLAEEDRYKELRRTQYERLKNEFEK